MTDDLLAAAAAALGAPQEMVLRSAQARAEAEGTTVEAVLATWAGGETPPPAPDSDDEAETAEPRAPQPAVVTDQQTAEAQDTQVQAAEAQAAQAEPTRAEEQRPEAPAAAMPVPDLPEAPRAVSVEEATSFEVVTTSATAGLKERTNASIPGWLGSLFVVVPLLAMFLLTSSGSPRCGEAGSLDVDPVTGEIVNCDGSEFTGGGDGGGPDYVAAGRTIFAGSGTCFGCHGPQGQGQGSFPALTAVNETFPSCSDHLRWVTLGSTGWIGEVGPTYPDGERQVGLGMPTFGGSLTDEEIASVVAFERVEFGGADQTETLVDCGLAGEPQDEQQEDQQPATES